MLCALGIGVGVDRPFARRRVGEQRHGDGAAAEALVGDGQALVFDAVGALDDQRQRQAGLGLARRVAQQRGDEHRLARAIDAALGVDEGVERARRVAAGDAAVGEVEGRLAEIEEAVVVAERRHQQAGGRAAGPARQAGIEVDAPVGAGRLGRQHFVVARDQPHLDARQRQGGGERTRQHMDAVVAGEGRQAEVGDDHPLRRELARPGRRRWSPPARSRPSTAAR